jgi:hypothetical protein
MKSSLRFFILFFLMFPGLFYGQQLENPGFENWENAGTVKDEPVDWSTIKTCDDPGIAAVAPVTFDRSEDAHSGNYSLKLYNVKIFNFIATGAITNGRFHAEYDLDSSYSYTEPSDAKWNTPFTARPDSLTGWFKFFPKEDDAAQFKVILHVDECQLPENGTMPNWVGMAVYVTEPAVTYDNWTRFSVPFTYFNDSIPEYVLTVINSGDSTSAIDSSYLLVDDLQLIYPPSGISNPGKSESFLITGDDRLVIKLESETEYLHQWFYLIDVTGQTVLSKKLDHNQVRFPDNLPRGVYVAVLNGRNQRHVQKIMIR